ncbi:ferric iron reductase [Nitrosococcus halophilus Nc 4]|uniref:Ferric iron reductase n=1 Tax=Nitrosococcus halophilus (strain Nc4) TaxID=472759 RepID=D5C319_NITHN|nr:siderophore-iron reductase FhuF [Nitrosococcus halophilus]ADE14911.1 ferric iron reductase [Nitrosococcus halophilus Nc 4]
MAAIPPLAPLFEGVLAPYESVLRLPDSDPRARPARDLLHSSTLNEVMAQYWPNCQHQDPRALLSAWSQFYFLRLLPPVLAANLIMGWSLPLALDGMNVIIGGNGLPVAFVLPDEGRPFDAGVSVQVRFQVLSKQHMAPLIRAWSCQTGLSERVFWGNGGRYLDWLLMQFQELGQPSQVWAPLQDWLNLPEDWNGGRNPFYQLYRNCPRLDREPPHRVRRTCCIRYRLSGISLCSDCPRSCRCQQSSLETVGGVRQF